MLTHTKIDKSDSAQVRAHDAGSFIHKLMAAANRQGWLSAWLLSINDEAVAMGAGNNAGKQRWAEGA